MTMLIVYASLSIISDTFRQLVCRSMLKYEQVEGTKDIFDELNNKNTIWLCRILPTLFISFIFLFSIVEFILKHIISQDNKLMKQPILMARVLCFVSMTMFLVSTYMIFVLL